VKAGTLICYDSAFPRASETLARRGAELIISPTCHAVSAAEVERDGRKATFEARRRHVIKYLGARAYEHTLFVCYVDNSGPAKRAGWLPGYAAIFGPDGEVIAEAEHGSDGAIYATLSASAFESARKDAVGHFHTQKDRRDELYD
jgi:predicted amidohydrolase